MSLIKVLEYGYGADGKTLKLIISVPNKCYIKGLYLENSTNVIKTNSTKSVNIIKVIQNNYLYSTDKLAFDKVFSFVESRYTSDPSKAVDIYELKDNFIWGTNMGITLNRQDLYFLTMELYFDSSSTYVIPESCGEDNSVLVFPIYNCLALKLNSLKHAKQHQGCDSCTLNKEFIDSVLQVNALELALSCGDFLFASKLWNKMHYTESVNTSKCHCYGN